MDAVRTPVVSLLVAPLTVLGFDAAIHRLASFEAPIDDCFFAEEEQPRGEWSPPDDYGALPLTDDHWSLALDLQFDTACSSWRAARLYATVFDGRGDQTFWFSNPRSTLHTYRLERQGPLLALFVDGRRVGRVDATTDAITVGIGVECDEYASETRWTLESAYFQSSTRYYGAGAADVARTSRLPWMQFHIRDKQLFAPDLFPAK